MKKPLLGVFVLLAMSFGAFSTSATATNHAASGTTFEAFASCSPPTWWPDWLPYYCNEK